MKKEFRNTQVIQWKENKIPASIRVGRVFLWIGAILFFIDSVLSLAAWGVRFSAHWVDYQGLYNVTINPLSFWDEPFDIINVFSDGAKPVIYILMFLAGMGAISWLKGKGPFLSWVSWAAIISMVVWIIDILIDIRSMVQTGFSWQAFLYNFFSMQLDIIFYSVGWLLAKDWLD